jgi:hypothetical protein
VLTVDPPGFAPPTLVTPVYGIPLRVAVPLVGLLSQIVPASEHRSLIVLLSPGPSGWLKFKPSCPPALKKYRALFALAKVTVKVNVRVVYQVTADVAVLELVLPWAAAFNRPASTRDILPAKFGSNNIIWPAVGVLFLNEESVVP